MPNPPQHDPRHVSDEIRRRNAMTGLALGVIVLLVCLIAAVRRIKGL
jgi:hypothetical protein